jgi:hypothetical protein
MAKVKKIKLPDGFSDIGPATRPEFAPNQTTMELFDREPYTLWRACSEWWRTLREDPRIVDSEYRLTAALML